MHKNSFNEFHINNLNKMCCNKSHLCSMEPHFSPCALQESSSAWRQHAEENPSKYYEGHMWNFQKLSQHPYSSSAGVSHSVNGNDNLLGPGEFNGKRRGVQAVNFLLFNQEVPLDERDTYTYKLQLH